MFRNSFRALAPVILLGLLGGTSSLAAGDKLSKKDKKWLEQEVGALITTEEVAIFEELESKDRKLFREIFWARRDPNTMTPDNEFTEGYKRRVKVADEQFQSQGRKGSTTDMGKIFILLGAPEDAGQRGGGDEFSGDTRTWTYAPNPDLGIPDGLTLNFRSQAGFGYRLARSDELEAALDQVKERYVNSSIRYQLDNDGRLMKPPAELDPNSPAKKLLQDLLTNKTESPAIPFAAEASFFRATPEDVYVAVLLEIDGDKLTWDGKKAKVTIFGIAETPDGRQNLPVESVVELERDEAGNVVYDIPFQLQPGSYSLYLGVLDDQSNTVGTKISPLEVPDFNKGELVLSSLVIFSEADVVKGQPGTPGHSFQFGTTQFTLKRGDTLTYKSTDSLNAFFFVYGFGLDESGKSHLTEQYIFFQDEQRKAQTQAQPLRTEKDIGLSEAGIPLSSFEPGNYKVQVKIIDNVTKETITKEIEFVVE